MSKDTPLIADRQYTIEEHLTRSKRNALPLDRRFVQRRTGNNRPSPGPLAAFVKRGREPALEQYLLLHAFASSDVEGLFDVRLRASTWARTIGGFIEGDGSVEKAALHLVSRNWSFLEQQKLIARDRKGRRARVWLLADDGSGDPYRHPGRGRRGQQLDDGSPGYLQLPYAYWRKGWHERLSLSAKAMLLIALSLGDGFPLPYGQVPNWYGISSSTAERGLDELQVHGLLHRELLQRPESDSPVGHSKLYYNELLPPFGPRGTLASSAHWMWRGPQPPPETQKARTRRRKTKTTKAPSRRAAKKSSK